MNQVRGGQTAVNCSGTPISAYAAPVIRMKMGQKIVFRQGLGGIREAVDYKVGLGNSLERRAISLG